MAVGYPYLATWRASDQTMRLFTFSPDNQAFAQTFTVGLPQNTAGSGQALLPYIAFTKDGSRLFTHNRPSAGGPEAGILRDPSDGSVKSPSSNGTPGGAQSGDAIKFAHAKLTDFFVGLQVRSLTNSLKAQADDTLLTLPNTTFPLTAAPTSFSIHPNETAAFIGGANANNRLAKKTGVDATNGTPQFATFTSVPELSAVTIVESRWSPSGDFLFCIDNAGKLYVFTYDGVAQTLTLSYNLTSVHGAGVSGALAVSSNNRYIAVGYFDGNAYSTVIYRRLGYILQEKLTISGMGQSLLFTADGINLLDCATKTAYTFNNNADQFLVNTTILAALPAAVTMAAISPHIPSQVLTGFVYKAGAKAIAANTFDHANLKLALLDSTASFNSAHTQFSDVAINPNGGASRQVSGNGWPVNGITLANPRFGVNNSGLAALLADTAKQILYNQITFRRALVYDATSQTPLVFLDFGIDYTTEKETTLVFNLSDFGVAEFTV